MQKRLPASLFLCTALIACGAETQQEEQKSLVITRIVMTAEPIEADKPLPVFTDFFDEGTSVIYAYIWIENAKTMTGSFPVQASWFSPNDLSPPIVRHVIDMDPDQDIAQFSLHNDGGLQNAPYKLIVRAGPKFTASGSMRAFVGMTPEAAQTFLEEEAVFLKVREEARAKAAIRQAQAEEEERKAAEAGSGSGSGVEVEGEVSDGEELPPGLTDGAGE